MCSYQFFSFFPYRRRVHRPSESGTIRRTLCAVDVGSRLTTFRRSSVRNAATPRRSLGAVSLAGSRFPSFTLTLLPKFYPLRFVFSSPSHIFPLAHPRSVAFVFLSTCIIPFACHFRGAQVRRLPSYPGSPAVYNVLFQSLEIAQNEQVTMTSVVICD